MNYSMITGIPSFTHIFRNLEISFDKKIKKKYYQIAIRKLLENEKITTENGK